MPMVTGTVDTDMDTVDTAMVDMVDTDMVDTDMAAMVHPTTRS